MCVSIYVIGWGALPKSLQFLPAGLTVAELIVKSVENLHGPRKIDLFPYPHKQKILSVYTTYLETI